MKQHDVNYSIALATYIGDEGFAKRLRDEQFRSFVMSQKEFIKNFLLTGFSIIDNQMDEQSNILAEPNFRSQYQQQEEVSINQREQYSKETTSEPPASKKNEPKIKSDTAIILADIEKFVQHLIIEKTGYPLEMVLTDVDLDDELGIDTVKKMEILAEIGTHYKMQVKRDLSLSQLTTIHNIAELVYKEIKISAT